MPRVDVPEQRLPREGEECAARSGSDNAGLLGFWLGFWASGKLGFWTDFNTSLYVVYNAATDKLVTANQLTFDEPFFP